MRAPSLLPAFAPAGAMSGWREDAVTWPTLLPPGGRHQREKLAVLGARPEQSLLGCDDGDARRCLETLCTQAAGRQPQAWLVDRSGWSAPPQGAALGRDGLVRRLGCSSYGLGDEVARALGALPAPRRLAALWALSFAEDLLLVDLERLRVSWLAVTLPGHWAPASVLGRWPRDLAPPPGMARADATRERAWLSAEPRLHAPSPAADDPGWRLVTAAALPAGLWWRRERQTWLPSADGRHAWLLLCSERWPLAALAATPTGRRDLAAAFDDDLATATARRALGPGRWQALRAWLNLPPDPARPTPPWPTKPR